MNIITFPPLYVHGFINGVIALFCEQEGETPDNISPSLIEPDGSLRDKLVLYLNAGILARSHIEAATQVYETILNEEIPIHEEIKAIVADYIEDEHNLHGMALNVFRGLVAVKYIDKGRFAAEEAAEMLADCADFGYISGVIEEFGIPDDVDYDGALPQEPEMMEAYLRIRDYLWKALKEEYQETET